MPDTDAFDINIGSHFLRKKPEVKMLSFQRPYALHCDLGSGLFSVPVQLFGQKESRLRYAARTSYLTNKYQLTDTSLKTDWRPCRYPWITSRLNYSRANTSISSSCFTGII